MNIMRRLKCRRRGYHISHSVFDQTTGGLNCNPRCLVCGKKIR